MADKTEHEISSGNVFADLDVPNPEEALAKADVAARVCRIIAESGLTSAQAASRLGIGLPELGRLQRGSHDRFSLEQIRQFQDTLLQDPSKQVRHPIGR